jgi:hypothetical protein
MQSKHIFAIIFTALTQTIFAQSATEKDSAEVNQINITPNQHPTDLNAIGSSVYVISDSLAMQTFAGANVLNTLRGNVPNIIFDSNLMNRGASLLGTNQPLIIDGVVYTGLIGDYYNLNAFEYKKVYAFNSGVSLLHYGDPVANGGIFLESKTGKDMITPTWELNSYLTYGWETPGNYSSVGSVPNEARGTIDHFNFGNSLAYMQDFGAVDTRVSYNYTFAPNNNFVRESRTGNHNFKVNTGFDIGKRFTARVIFDQYYEKQHSDPRIKSNISFYNDEEEIIERSTHANLMLRYQPLSWLSITSQSTIGRAEFNIEEKYGSKDEAGTVEHRKMANLFVTASKQITSRFGLNAFTGIQTSEHEYEASGSFGLATKGNTRNSVFLGSVLDYKKTIYANLNFRKTNNKLNEGNYSMYYESPYINDGAFSLATSWIFSNTFKTDRSILSYGKIRFMVGGQPFNYQMEYPLREGPPGLDAWQTTTEFGTDLSFFNNRLFVSPTVRSINQDIEYNGLYQFSSRVWELTIGGSPVSREKFQWIIKGIWGKYDTYRRAGTNTSIGLYPDWRTSLSNQFLFGNTFITLLIDGVRGEDYYQLYSSFQRTFIDETQFRVRDLSIGHNWNTSSGNRASISISGRNLFRLYSESDYNIDGYTSGYTGNALRSVSVSLSLIF